MQRFLSCTMVVLIGMIFCSGGGVGAEYFVHFGNCGGGAVNPALCRQIARQITHTPNVQYGERVQSPLDLFAKIDSFFQTQLFIYCDNL